MKKMEHRQGLLQHKLENVSHLVADLQALINEVSRCVSCSLVLLRIARRLDSQHALIVPLAAHLPNNLILSTTGDTGSV